MLTEFSSCLQSLPSKPGLFFQTIYPDLGVYPGIKKDQGALLPLKGLFLPGSQFMKKTLHPLFFASFIEKYYFSFVWIFLITMEVNVFCILLHSSKRSCADIYYKSCKVHLQLSGFHSQLWNS